MEGRQQSGMNLSACLSICLLIKLLYQASVKYDISTVFVVAYSIIFKLINTKL